MSNSPKDPSLREQGREQQREQQREKVREAALYTAAQVREADRIAIEELGIPGIVLMKRAAAACVQAVFRHWSQVGSATVVCGTGNNAADGYIIAGLLADRGVTVSVLMFGREPDAGSDAQQAFEFCQASAAVLHVLNKPDDPAKHANPINRIISASDIVIDALLGTGITGDVRHDYRGVIEMVNQSLVPVLSVDLPSGLCADTGAVLGCCVTASLTVTFIGMKLGLLTNDGPEYVGRLVFADLGVPRQVFDAATNTAVNVAGVVEVLSLEQTMAALPRRHRNAHKVRHGHLLIVGGDEGMGGAIIMAAQAAIHCGCGLVSVATRSSNLTAMLARQPEIMAVSVSTAEDFVKLAARADALVIGPGLGRSVWSQTLFGALKDIHLAMVVDADGLNQLAENPMMRDNWVLTPHPGEAARLLPGREIQTDRRAAVLAMQTLYGGVCLLKGAGTLIAREPEVTGDVAGESDTCLVPFGNPAMAVAGMGDVLSGVIGSLLAQGLSPWEATRLGAVVHSIAADEVADSQGDRGLLATELIKPIRSLLNHKSVTR